MLAPFTALLPRRSGIPYQELEKAAKVLRVDPASYQSARSVEYVTRAPSLYRWEIVTEHDTTVVGVVGVFPLDRLIPHEQTTAAALTRPRHQVQIRPVMALIDAPLPAMAASGAAVTFGDTHRHALTPVVLERFDIEDAVIADGHHRTAAARRAGGDPGIMTMIVSTIESEFEAGAFHRVFATPVRLPDRLEGARLFDESPQQSLAAGRISLVTPDGSIGVAIDPDHIPEAVRGIPAGAAAAVLLPALGLLEEDAVYLEDGDAALRAAHYGTAILLPGSGVAAVVAAARRGVVLPPKSTRFRPKPARGFLMRPL